MCWNNHSIAALGSWFPVASKAFRQRMRGKPIASNCARASALNSGRGPTMNGFLALADTGDGSGGCANFSRLREEASRLIVGPCRGNRRG